MHWSFICPDYAQGLQVATHLRKPKQAVEGSILLQHFFNECCTGVPTIISILSIRLLHHTHDCSRTTVLVKPQTSMPYLAGWQLYLVCIPPLKVWWFKEGCHISLGGACCRIGGVNKHLAPTMSEVAARNNHLTVGAHKFARKSRGYD